MWLFMTKNMFTFTKKVIEINTQFLKIFLEFSDSLQCICRPQGFLESSLKNTNVIIGKCSVDSSDKRSFYQNDTFSLITTMQKNKASEQRRGKGWKEIYQKNNNDCFGVMKIQVEFFPYFYLSKFCVMCITFIIDKQQLKIL